MPAKTPARDKQADIVKKDGRYSPPAGAVIEGRARRQIQTVPERQLALPSRPRGLVGQVGLALLEPAVFFRGLPFATGRHWLWTAILILALVALSAVRYEALSNTSAAPASFGPPVSMEDPMLSGGGGGGGGGMMIGGGPVGAPVDGGMPPVVEPAANPTDVSATWTTAILAASHLLLGWGILSVLMSEVTLFNGRPPHLGLNLRIAIWATLPLGLMAGLQLLYYAAGGQAGQPGLAGLLDQWPGYADLPLFAKSLALSLASRLTLFWLWSLALISIGARHALNGKTWAVALVVLAWVAVLVIAPVLTGAVKAEESLPDASSMPLDVPSMNGPLGEDFPGGADMMPGAGGPDLSQDAGGLGLIPEATGEPGLMPPIAEMTPLAESTGEAAAPVESEAKPVFTLQPPVEPTPPVRPNKG